MFLSHRTARFYFRKFAQHTIPQHMNSTRSAILFYIELALVLEDEDEDEDGGGPWPTQTVGRGWAHWQWVPVVNKSLS